MTLHQNFGYGSIDIEEPATLSLSRRKSSSQRPASAHGSVDSRIHEMVAVVLGLSWLLLALGMSLNIEGMQIVRAQFLRSNADALPMHWTKHDPAQPLFFNQIVDHNVGPASGTYKQRYYQNTDYWKGPGHPIFLIFGGEGPLERILYPFISEVLVKQFGAVTLNPEHRFFGVSFPVSNYTKEDIREQLTPRQAIEDALNLIQSKKSELGCGPPGSSTYCPVMTVGGSYAGLLAVLARKSYPEVVDIGYGASPCLLLFGHQSSPYHYYEYITKIAGQISPGCPDAVRDVVDHLQTDLTPMKAGSQELRRKAEEYGICPDSLSPNVDGAALARELIEYTSSSFGGTAMDYYPPGPDRQFYQGCEILEDNSNPVEHRMQDYFQMMSNSSECHPIGPSEEDADLWDALCCYWVPQVGKSDESMWPPSKYNLQNDVDYCEKDYGIKLDVNYLDEEFGLADLSVVSHLIFTNGEMDPWYGVSYTDPIPDNPDIAVLTMENGAHHSDLTHQLQEDTPDVNRVHEEIAHLIDVWLNERAASEPVHHGHSRHKAH